MTGFEADIAAQGALLHSLLTDARQEGTIAAAAALASPERPIVFTGMGSSLAAAQPAAARAAAAGLWAMAFEAGELLHYGRDVLRPGSLVILVSQSGRSAETVALGSWLRSTGDTRLVAVVNEVDTPLARLADVVMPIHAGDEVTVSTKTFIATLFTLHELTDTLVGARGHTAGSALECGLADSMTFLAADPEVSSAAAQAFADISSLVVIARGPALAAANYGALILKEASALHAEAMAAGSFRHGPIEITGPRVGVVVMAPRGPTRSLCVRLAADTARLSSPTWLLTSREDGSDGVTDLADLNGPLVSYLPDVPEPLSPFIYSVPIQHLAVRLARLRDRQPGAVARSSKVTAVE